MSLSATCYPQPGKPKALRICEAFARGCDGAVAEHTPARLGDGAAVFYGVRPAWSHLWRQAKAERRDWYYLDNSYFDAGRERLFRVTRNAIQHDGRGYTDGSRLNALGVTVKPWRMDGRHILVCQQSEEFMATVAHDMGWLADTVQKLRRITTRPLVIRRKGDATPLCEALADCWAVVTWSSAAAVEALVQGIPVHCAPACAAHTFSTALENIDRPRRLYGREQWAEVLADNQWTLDEIRNGDAWQSFHTRAGIESTACRTATAI